MKEVSIVEFMKEYRDRRYAVIRNNVEYYGHRAIAVLFMPKGDILINYRGIKGESQYMVFRYNYEEDLYD